MILSEYFKNIGSEPYVTLLFIIIIVKFIFFMTTICIIILSRITPSNIHIDKLHKFHQYVYYIFAVLVSILLIFLFTPYKTLDYKLDKETKFIIYLYGWITILFLTKQQLTNHNHTITLNQ
jgi:uncharacterized protein YhhL (DUF1145 family)